MSSRDARVEDRVIRVEEADQILDLLVGDHAADKQDVRPVVVELIARRTSSAGRSRCEKSGTTGSTAVRGKPERLEILAVELGVAEREIAAIGVRPQLAPAAKALARQRAMDADEILRRRDVVVDERHPIRQRERRARRLRAEREVMEQQVVGMADVDELAVVARQRLEPVVGGFDEDLRLVAGRAQHALDAEHLVADRVAVAERREHLVNAGSTRRSRDRPSRTAAVPRRGRRRADGRTSAPRSGSGGEIGAWDAARPRGSRACGRPRRRRPAGSRPPALEPAGQRSIVGAARSSAARTCRGTSAR